MAFMENWYLVTRVVPKTVPNTCDNGHVILLTISYRVSTGHMLNVIWHYLSSKTKHLWLWCTIENISLNEATGQLDLAFALMKSYGRPTLLIWIPHIKHNSLFKCVHYQLSQLDYNDHLNNMKRGASMHMTCDTAVYITQVWLSSQTVLQTCCIEHSFRTSFPTLKYIWSQ